MDIFVMFMDKTYFKFAWMRKTCPFNTIKSHMDANIGNHQRCAIINESKTGNVVTHKRSVVYE